MTKTLLNDAIRELPNEFSIDELIEKLILLESFKQGREQFEKGNYFTHQEVGELLKI